MTHHTHHRVRVLWGKATSDIQAKVIREIEAMDKNLPEYEARGILSSIVDIHRQTDFTIMYDGNTVWHKPAVLEAMRRIQTDGMTVFSQYLYQFFTLACGSIAHYDINGWTTVYPTFGKVKEFCLNNEFGTDILSFQPKWAYDRQEICKNIFRRFFGTDELPENVRRAL